MERRPAPICSNCNVGLTVEHILVSCRQYTQKRNRFFNHLIRAGKVVSVKTVLEESDDFSIRRIIGFLSDIGVLKMI